jgi:hypothetical protein
MWVAVDKDNSEGIYQAFPKRFKKSGYWASGEDDAVIAVPSGTINKLLGRNLTWKDEPVEIKGYTEQV